MEHLVSVIIPTYSRPDFIIRSIKSVLTQSYPNIEIIVVDDNGIGTIHQKETETILLPYIKANSIKYIAHSINKGGSAARNTGLNTSNGEYVTFLDDDDEMDPRKIEYQVNAIEQSGQPNVMAAYCSCVIKKGDRIITKKMAYKNGNFHDDMLRKKFGLGSGSNLLLKSEAAKKIGGYDESFIRHQDIEFTIRYFRHYNIVAVPDVLLIKHNDTKPRRPNARDYLKIEEHFLSYFKSDIQTLKKTDANDVYYNSYFGLAISAANESDCKFVWSMIKKACKYRHIKLRDCMRLLYNYIFKPQKR